MDEEVKKIIDLDGLSRYNEDLKDYLLNTYKVYKYKVTSSSTSINFNITDIIFGNTEDKNNFIDILNKAKENEHACFVLEFDYNLLVNPILSRIAYYIINFGDYSYIGNTQLVTCYQIFDSDRADSIRMLKYSGSNPKYISIRLNATIVDNRVTDITRNSLQINEIDTYLGVNNDTEYTPTSTYHPATKGYVDSAVAKETVMPTASATYAGKVVQYIGDTTLTYTKGHFYECSSSSPYTWSEVSFGGGGGESSVTPYTIIELVNGFYASDMDLNFNDDLQLIGEKLEEHYQKYGAGGYIGFKNPSSNYWYSEKLTTFEFRGKNTSLSFYEIGKIADGRPQALYLQNGDVLWYDFYYSSDDPLVMSRYSPAETMPKCLTLSNNPYYVPVDAYDPATKDYVDKASISGVRRLQLSSAIMSNFTTINKNYITGVECKPILLKLINDGMSAGITSVYFVGSSDDYYEMYRLILPTATSGTQTARLFMYPALERLAQLVYGATYWYGKDISIIFTDNVATDISVPNSGKYTHTWEYLSGGNTATYNPVGMYNPATKNYVDTLALIESITNSNTSYTIANLTGNKSYKLGEITSLTITSSTASDYESVIYFESGSTPTDISIPDTITNLGDAPTLTTSAGVSTGTCVANKNYIIAILNNIAVWKEY